MEFVIITDVLRRANISVVAASVYNTSRQYIQCSKGIKIVPDLTLDEAVKKAGKGSYNIVILPESLNTPEIYAMDGFTVAKHIIDWRKSGRFAIGTGSDKAFEFALQVVESLLGPVILEQVAKELLIPHSIIEEYNRKHKV